jgi:2'-5' RNA ligase
MSNSIRAFIAIDMPDDVTAALNGLQQELKSMRLTVRWVRPENIHLTLKFLGDIKPADIETIAGAMADAVEDWPPFMLTLSGIGFFPGVNRPRVIWVGLGGETRHLTDLQSYLADRLAAVGFPREKRSYQAHLTLGRIRQAKRSDQFKPVLQQFSDWSDEEFTADRISLLRSDLKPSGAVYTVLKQVKLSGMANDD